MKNIFLPKKRKPTKGVHSWSKISNPKDYFICAKCGEIRKEVKKTKDCIR